MILGLKIDAQWVERVHDLAHALSADAGPKVIDLLLQVRKANELALVGERLHARPLVVRRILGFVHNDEWVAISGDIAQSLASSEEIVGFGCKEVEDDKPFLSKKALPLDLPSGIGVRSARPQGGLIGREEETKPLGSAKKVAIGADDFPEKAVKGLHIEFGATALRDLALRSSDYSCDRGPREAEEENRLARTQTTFNPHLGLRKRDRSLPASRAAGDKSVALGVQDAPVSVGQNERQGSASCVLPRSPSVDRGTVFDGSLSG